MTSEVPGVGGVPPTPLVTPASADGGPSDRSPQTQSVASAASYWVARVVEFIMGVALVGVALMVCLQVLFRFVLGAPLHYTEEVARYLTIWAALLGASLAMRSGTHFSVGYLVGHLPSPFDRVVIAMSRLLVVGFLITFVVTSSLLLERGLVESSPASRIPMVLVYVAAPISGLLMLFFIAAQVVGGDPRSLPSEEFEDLPL